MFILNTTFIIHDSIKTEFLEWVGKLYLDAAKKAGIFSDPRVAQVLAQVEPGTTSIAVQFTCPDLAAAEHWHDETAAILRDDLQARWGENALFFTTYLQLLDVAAN